MQCLSTCICWRALGRDSILIPNEAMFGLGSTSLAFLLCFALAPWASCLQASSLCWGLRSRFMKLISGSSEYILLQYFDLCDFSGSNLATCFNDKARFRGAHQPRSYFAVLWLQGSLYLCRCASFLGLGAGDHGLPPGKTALSRGPEPNIAEGVERALRGF